MKLFLHPQQYDPNSGVGQVIEAQRRYLPEFGIELVDNPNEAELRAAHIWSPLVDNDVQHVHGLLWSGDEPGHPQWESDANRAILETSKRALAITVPSEWVSVPFKRDMRLSPTVIGHGLTLSEWKPLPVSERDEYLLWNKNRADIACNPQPIIELGRKGIPAVSTFGDDRFMDVIGPQPHARMKDYLRYAGVYLSTAKETFGIGILEALACGVPVLGYAYGGIVDLIQHKVNGYLVEPGDIEGLAEGYKWLMAHREEMQPAILSSVANRDWKEIIGQYAELYRAVLEEKQRPRKVSVVIPCYNYGRFIEGAIDSVLNQTLKPQEIIVVDDGSTDNSLQVRELYDPEISGVQVISQENQGVAAARNNGIRLATGDYIICLDADDFLDSKYIETLFKVMEADRSLGIAYTGLMMHFESGQSSVSGWPPQVEFDRMAKPGVPPPNAIPCAAMFRKDMWERAGGYRQEYAPGEDVEFWLRGMSVGFNARKVTDAPLFNYRLHGGSASRTKQYIDITGDKPWTTNKNLMPMAAPTEKPNLVRSYSEPLVSVIIPVGPGHAQHLNKALDSLIAQTFKNWEVIVIDDKQYDPYEKFIKFDKTTYPFIKTFMSIFEGKQGAGAARNIGIREAKAPLLFFLDADDWLVPTALEKMVQAYQWQGKTFVYSDWMALGPTPLIDPNLDPTQQKEIELSRKQEQAQLKQTYGLLTDSYVERMPCQEYNQQAVREKIQHAVSILIETEAVRAVNGFDETLPTWEDWDFFIKLAAKGYCGVRVPEPLLVYQLETGTRRKKAFEPGSTIYKTITDKWKGVEFMACCGNNAKITRKADAALSYPAANSAIPDGRVRLRYVGDAQASFKVLGKYEVANDNFSNLVDVLPDEVNKLLQLGTFVEV